MLKLTGAKSEQWKYKDKESIQKELDQMVENLNKELDECFDECFDEYNECETDTE